MHKRFGISCSDTVNCKTSGVIYLVSCNKCGLQYVGQTSRKFYQCMYEPCYDISKNKKQTFLVKHFNLSDHCAEDFLFQVIEVVDCQSNKLTLLNRKAYWIHTLNTAYQYGLNDSIQGYGNVSDGKGPFHSKKHPYFNSLIPRRWRKHGPRKRRKQSENINIMTQLDAIFRDNCVHSVTSSLHKQTQSSLIFLQKTNFSWKFCISK